MRSQLLTFNLNPTTPMTVLLAFLNVGECAALGFRTGTVLLSGRNTFNNEFTTVVLGWTMTESELYDSLGLQLGVGIPDLINPVLEILKTVGSLPPYELVTYDGTGVDRLQVSKIRVDADDNEIAFPPGVDSSTAKAFFRSHLGPKFGLQIGSVRASDGARDAVIYITPSIPLTGNMAEAILDYLMEIDAGLDPL